MATKILKSIKGKVVRITRLTECGEVDYGSCASLVSECFVSVTLAAEIEAGDEYLQKSAWGDLCIIDKDADRIKWVNATIQFAEINPDALDILTNATPAVDGSDTIGATWNQNPNETAFALEVWTKRTGEPCSGSPDWGYFVLPFTRNGRIDGDMTIENGVLTVSVVANAWPAVAAWGTGPYPTNPWLPGAFPTDEIFGMIVTDVQPPADSGGCTALVAPAP